MNKLSTDKRIAVVSSLVEGNSIRSTTRMTGVAKNTIQRLVLDLGECCMQFHDEAVRGVSSKHIQCDELWAFCGMKERNVPAEKKGVLGYGDVWTWTCLDSDSKLMVSWLIGRRDMECARAFVKDLASRLTTRPQISTDGLGLYATAIDEVFGSAVDYATVIKSYGNEGGTTPERKYSPADCTGVKKTIIMGSPDKKSISTSHIERSNKTVRMGLRRYTRLTDGHSKKITNHVAAVSVFFTYYNFARIHSSIRCTPAQEAGIISKLWDVRDIVELLDRYPAAPEDGEDSN
ncbi:MAG: DDE-type integrase/transposase/recombinase [Bacteroidetes bacterium]|nr:DDE-type integrase/transposase/recombinase [Bacteroidota bacterium]